MTGYHETSASRQRRPSLPSTKWRKGQRLFSRNRIGIASFSGTMVQALDFSKRFALWKSYEFVSEKLREAALRAFFVSPSPRSHHNRRPAAMNRAVFLDRDGVLNEEKNYLHRVEDFILIPGSSAALGRLTDAGFLLFVITNQSGAGRGYFTLADVDKLHAH